MCSLENRIRASVIITQSLASLSDRSKLDFLIVELGVIK